MTLNLPYSLLILLQYEWNVTVAIQWWDNKVIPQLWRMSLGASLLFFIVPQPSSGHHPSSSRDVCFGSTLIVLIFSAKIFFHSLKHM